MAAAGDGPRAWVEGQVHGVGTGDKVFGPESFTANRIGDGEVLLRLAFDVHRHGDGKGRTGHPTHQILLTGSRLREIGEVGQTGAGDQQQNHQNCQSDVQAFHFLASFHILMKVTTSHRQAKTIKPHMTNMRVLILGAVLKVKLMFESEVKRNEAGTPSIM